MSYNLKEFENRSPGLVLLLGLITLGLYMIYWYYKVYDEMKRVTGSTPTGNDYVLDFILFLLTCALWGIYVDYRISRQLEELLAASGQPAQDTGTLVVVLDVAAYLTAWLTNFVSSAIQQDIMNKLGASAPQIEQAASEPPAYS